MEGINKLEEEIKRLKKESDDNHYKQKELEKQIGIINFNRNKEELETKFLHKYFVLKLSNEIRYIYFYSLNFKYRSMCSEISMILYEYINESYFVLISKGYSEFISIYKDKLQEITKEEFYSNLDRLMNTINK